MEPKIKAYGNCDWILLDKLIQPKYNTQLQCDYVAIFNSNGVPVYLQIEPEVVSKSTEWLINNHGFFKYIFTFNDRVLASCPNAHKYIFGTSWIKPQDYLNIDISLKKFQISSICGWKIDSDGHKLRRSLYHSQKSFPIKFYRSSQPPILPYISNNEFLPDNNKIHLFKEFQFSVIIENSRQTNYFTEKLIDCLITKTIPIYWGCPNISEYFDTTGWIIFDNQHDLKEKLNTLNESYYTSYMNNIEKNYRIALTYVDFQENLNRAIRLIPDW
jgi:hypothetical protein